MNTPTAQPLPTERSTKGPFRLAIAMLIDIFSERGFHAVVDKHIREVPERIDLATGRIIARTKFIYRTQINFRGSEIRRG